MKRYEKDLKRLQATIFLHTQSHLPQLQEILTLCVQ